jgi:hypothetical protein
MSTSQLALDALKTRFEGVNDLAIFRHCLGIQRIARIPHVASGIANYTIVVCIDTEHWTLNSDEMTELGVGTIATQDVLSLSRSQNIGEHGENLMRQAQFYLFRLKEKVHLKTSNENSRGPLGNRFGQARFASFSEMRTILKNEFFVKPIVGEQSLVNYHHPIIVLGHALGHDTDHLNGKDLGFDVSTIGTIVRYIDTQEIAKQCGVWRNTPDKIGLSKLVGKLGVQHTDPHTAANDVARTMISAILLTIPIAAMFNCARSPNEVALDLETYTQTNFVSVGGDVNYCGKCASTAHIDEDCLAKGLICTECVSRGLTARATTHIALHCPTVRDEVRHERLRWFSDQHDRKPKDPFSSTNRLQAFGPNAPVATPSSQAEVIARRRHYSIQRGINTPSVPFVWRGRFWQASFGGGSGGWGGSSGNRPRGNGREPSLDHTPTAHRIWDGGQQ